MTAAPLRIAALCFTLASAGVPASAQVMPTVIRDQGMARAALKEVNAALQKAIRGGQRAELEAALKQATELTGNLNDLGYTGLQREVTVTLNLYQEAALTLLRVLTISCEKGNLPDGLTGADILRSVGTALSRGSGAARVQEFQKRIPACLRLTLQIDSAISASEMNYFVHVEVVVPLEFDLTGGFYRGAGRITVLTQKATPKGGCLGRFNNAPATFVVNRLDVKAVDATHIGSVELGSYQVGQLNNSGTLVCPGGAPPIPIGQMNWTTLFQIARMKRDLTGPIWTLGRPAGTVASAQLHGPFAEYVSEATDIILRRSVR